ncbi:hypothetical protein MKEN_00626400 [Mycena kentingensis (nom. inval.)]|nr:hypothetical protein MKEN_00626400 [Mycena kentingensis (nom. inval.)]
MMNFFSPATMNSTATTAAQPPPSTRVRTLWRDFEDWVSSVPRKTFHESLNNQYRTLDAQYARISRPTSKDAAEHESTRLAFRRKLEAEVVTLIREQWVARMAAAELRDEDWGEMSSQEREKVERVLGDLVSSSPELRPQRPKFVEAPPSLSASSSASGYSFVSPLSLVLDDDADLDESSFENIPPFSTEIMPQYDDPRRSRSLTSSFHSQQSASAMSPTTSASAWSHSGASSPRGWGVWSAATSLQSSREPSRSGSPERKQGQPAVDPFAFFSPQAQAPATMTASASALASASRRAPPVPGPRYIGPQLVSSDSEADTDTDDERGRTRGRSGFGTSTKKPANANANANPKAKQTATATAAATDDAADAFLRTISANPSANTNTSAPISVPSKPKAPGTVASSLAAATDSELDLSPGDLSDADDETEAEAEAAFERFRQATRAAKIREFHAEAAELDIALAESLYAIKKTKTKMRDGEEAVGRRIAEHEAEMYKLRKSKEAERKEVVRKERERKREEVRERRVAERERKEREREREEEEAKKRRLVAEPTITNKAKPAPTATVVAIGGGKNGKKNKKQTTQQAQAESLRERLENEVEARLKKEREDKEREEREKKEREELAAKRGTKARRASNATTASASTVSDDNKTKSARKEVETVAQRQQVWTPAPGADRRSDKQESLSTSNALFDLEQFMPGGFGFELGTSAEELNNETFVGTPTPPSSGSSRPMSVASTVPSVSSSRPASVARPQVWIPTETESPTTPASKKKTATEKLQSQATIRPGQLASMGVLAALAGAGADSDVAPETPRLRHRQASISIPSPKAATATATPVPTKAKTTAEKISPVPTPVAIKAQASAPVVVSRASQQAPPPVVTKVPPPVISKASQQAVPTNKTTPTTATKPVLATTKSAPAVAKVTPSVAKPMSSASKAAAAAAAQARPSLPVVSSASAAAAATKVVAPPPPTTTTTTSSGSGMVSASKQAHTQSQMSPSVTKVAPPPPPPTSAVKKPGQSQSQAMELETPGASSSRTTLEQMHRPLLHKSLGASGMGMGMGMPPPPPAPTGGSVWVTSSAAAAAAKKAPGKSGMEKSTSMQPTGTPKVLTSASASASGKSRRMSDPIGAAARTATTKASSGKDKGKGKRVTVEDASDEEEETARGRETLPSDSRYIFEPKPSAPAPVTGYAPVVHDLEEMAAQEESASARKARKGKGKALSSAGDEDDLAEFVMGATQDLRRR